MFLERFNSLVDSLIDRHHTNVEQRVDLLQTAATLILAEEIHKLSTTASALATATTAMGSAISQLNTDFNTAWPIIQAALQNPGSTPQADIDAAVAAMNGVAGQLSTMDTDFQSVIPAQTTPPTT